MNERQFFQARAAAKQEYDEKVRALELSWVMLNKTPVPKQPAAAKRRNPANGPNGRPLLAKALVEIMREMPAEFNTLDIDKVLRAHHPEFASASRSTVSHTMKRLAAGLSPPIEIIEIGKGKRPTRYRKLMAAAEASLGLDDL